MITLCIIICLLLNLAYFVILKFFANNENNNPIIMSIYCFLCYCLVGLIGGAVYYFHYQPVFVPLKLLAMLNGFMVVFGNMLLIKCYKKAPGVIVNGLLGLNFTIIAVGGIILFHEPINLKIIIGIISAGLALLFFNLGGKNEKDSD